MNRLPVNFVNILIQKLTGYSLEEKPWKMTCDMIDKTWPLADVFSSFLIDWLSRENKAGR